MKLKPIKVKPGSWFDPHPFAEDYPLVEGPEMWAMADHMKKNIGFVESHPIVLYRERNGPLVILDGRRRQMACKRAAIEPAYLEFVGTPLEALYYVEAANLHRRNLGEDDRAIVNKKSIGRRAILAAEKASAKIGNEKHGNRSPATDLPDSTEEPKTLEEAAREQGIGRSSAVAGKKVLEDGTPELKEAVIDGTIPVKEAAKVAELPEKDQDKFVHRARKPKKPIRNGSVSYDWKIFNRNFGALIREVDKIGNILGCKDGYQCEQMRSLLGSFLSQFKMLWKMKKGEEAPTE